MTLTRRKFVVHGVAVGAACWVAPTIVSVPVAFASDVGSRPPRSTKPPSSPPETVTKQPMMGPPLATGIPAQMPFTGQELKKEAVLGAAALGAGAVIVGLTHTPKRELPL